MRLEFRELIAGNSHHARTHVPMSSAAEFRARNNVFSGGSEHNFFFADVTGNDLKFLSAVRKGEAMDNVGARHTEANWNSDSNNRARGYKVVLLRDQSDGKRSVRFDGGSKIALDEFALQMECEGIDPAGSAQQICNALTNFVWETDAKPDCDPEDSNDCCPNDLPFSHSDVTAF